jgi:hypothetical protein
MITEVLVLQPHHPNELGFVPSFLDEHDPRPAAEQFHANYIGGWHPQDGFKRSNNGGGFQLTYPGDATLHPFAMMKLRKELILVYPHGYVGIFHADGSCEIARLD